MNKKILSLLIVATLMITLTVPSHSVVKAKSVGKNNASQVITVLGIMETDHITDAKSQLVVTRAEFAQMMVNMSSYKNVVSQTTNVSLFKDVTKKHWAASYIKVAVSEQWMSGYLSGKFKPTKPITLQQAVNAIVKLLGYESTDFTGNKNTAKMKLYYSKKLNKNISKTKSQTLSTVDCMNLFYNTLITTTKSGTVYGTSLGYTLNLDGEIDYLNVVNKEMKGPIVAGADWKSELPFYSENGTCYRNSVKSSMESIQLYDILYYSEKLKTVWSYSEKVSGTLQAIAPNQLSPTEATIAGNTFKLGTQEMIFEFSTLGSFELGDVVTVLLGKDDNIVGVLTEENYTATISGVILEVGETLSTLSNTNTSLKKYMVVLDSYGRKYTVEYDKSKGSFLVDTVVDITYTDTGVNIAYSNKRFEKPLSGKVNAKGTQLGDYYLAEDIRILDLQGDNYISVYRSRLAGVVLYISDILDYTINSSGEIQSLILKDVTGDMDRYGILLEDVSFYQNSAFVYSYTYLLDGDKGTCTPSSLKSALLLVPSGFTYKGKDMDNIYNLSNIAVSSIKGTKVVGGAETYTLSDKTVVYYLNHSNYYLTELSAVDNLSKFSLTAYYDNIITRGGRIRIIVARDK